MKVEVSLKKILSVFMCFVIMVSCCATVSAENQGRYYGITPELIEYEKRALDKI